MSCEAYEKGYQSEQAGVGWFENPYRDHTTEARRWVDGKVQAIIDERTQIESDLIGLDQNDLIYLSILLFAPGSFQWMDDPYVEKLYNAGLIEAKDHPHIPNVNGTPMSYYKYSYKITDKGRVMYKFWSNFHSI